MQNSFFSKINVSSRILILLILVFNLLLTNSICFMLMFSIFILILLISNDKCVKYYLDLLKKVKFLLLFIFITYIIMVGNVFYTFLILYKVILIILLVDTFISTVKFETLTNGIKTLLKPLGNQFKIDNISLNVSIFIYFLIYYMNSKEEIISKYSKYKFGLKNNLLPRLYLTNFKLKKLETDLKLKFYKPKFEEVNVKSNIIVYVFVFLLILVVFKEVIL